MYRSVASGEGSGRSNRVHNRLDQAVGTGTDYTLTGSTARVDFGTTDAQVDIPNGGTYLILATIQFVGDVAAPGMSFMPRSVTPRMLWMLGSKV